MRGGCNPDLRNKIDGTLVKCNTKIKLHKKGQVLIYEFDSVSKEKYSKSFLSINLYISCNMLFCLPENHIKSFEVCENL